jgi:FKBP-type peptidyl-prolyl cis-trans isomerase 2
MHRPWLSIAAAEYEVRRLPQAKDGDKVQVHYKGTLEDGTEFDSSMGRDPMEFTLGQGQLIPGFEKAVIGMDTGKSKKVTITEDEAYGPRREDMVMVVERKQLPPDMKPEIGERLQLSQGEQAFTVTVTDASTENVTLDANHPLAGKTLIFDIELVAIV